MADETGDPADVSVPEIVRAAAIFDALRDATTDLPGVTRKAYGEGEAFAHAQVAALADELGLETEHDYAGNQYMTLPGRDRSAPAILIGSHMDTVPHGGNFDGAAGVVSGMAALHRLTLDGWQPAQNVTVVAIRAEEIAWFPAPYIGSRMAFGLAPPELYDTVKRSDNGRTLGEHIAATGYDLAALKAGRAWLDPARIRCYIEPHIEQGPILVAEAIPVGIVSGIRGNYRYRFCEVVGEYNHAGAIPRSFRRDALFAAGEFVGAVERRWDEIERAGGDFVCTIGRFHTDPDHHTITKIPGRIDFSIDMRSLDAGLLHETDAFLRAEAARIAGRRSVGFDLGEGVFTAPSIMDEELRAILRRQAQALGVRVADISSGAGHDCMTFANLGVPSAMIFIRNDHGSHNADEAMDIGDFAQATALLVGLLRELG